MAHANVLPMATLKVPSWLAFKPVERLTLQDRYLLVRQLYVLQKAGVPLLSSLQAIGEQLPASPLQRTLRTITQDLLGGHTLSQAFARHARSFDPLFISMIKIGEAGGLLEQILQQLARLFEWEMDFRAKVKQALQYPLIVLATLGVAIIIIVTFVLPRFAQLFSAWRIELPFQTKLILGLGTLISRYGVLMALAAIGGISALVWLFRTDKGQLWWHRTQLKLPILGPLFMQISMARFSRTLAALNASGVSILEALSLTGEGVNNRHIRNGLQTVIERVRGGESLAGALKATRLFPPIVVQMVATGEETGRIDELLASVADYYDQQATYLLRQLVTYIEPALLIVVGLGVLFLATSILVPMWDVVRVLRR